MGPAGYCWVPGARDAVTFLGVSRGTGNYHTAPSTSRKFLNLTHTAISWTTGSTIANMCLLLLEKATCGLSTREWIEQTLEGRG